MPDRTTLRRMLAPLAALLLVLALGTVLAACGDDDKSSGTETSTQAGGEAEQIRTLFLAAAADPATKLCDSATDQFKQVITGKSGAAATRECVTRARQLPPFKGVKITNIRVEGTTATATVSAQGQPADEQRFEKVGGEWKIASDAAPPGGNAPPPSSGGN